MLSPGVAALHELCAQLDHTHLHTTLTTTDSYTSKDPRAVTMLTATEAETRQPKTATIVVTDSPEANLC